MFLANEWGATGTDQIPDAYNMQVQTYMLITGYDKAHVVVLLGGQTYREYEVNKDTDLQGQIIKKAKDFWDCVVYDELTEEFQRPEDYQYKPLVDDTYEASQEVQDKIFSLIDVRKKLSEGKKEEKALIQDIVNAADNKSIIVDQSGRTIATYAESQRNGFDTKRFKEEHPEQFNVYTKVSKFRRFSTRVKA